MDLNEQIAERKRQRAADGKKQGRVVSSYYSSEDYERLTTACEAAGISPGGLQHEALLLLLEQYEAKVAAKTSTAVPALITKAPTLVKSSTTLEASEAALEELSKVVKAKHEDLLKVFGGTDAV